MISWPQQLIDDLARRRAIIMIGSGVSRHSVGIADARPPTWRGFLQEALKLCDPQPKHIKDAIRRGQYLDACEWLKRHLDDRWTQQLRASFLTPKYRSADIHRLLYQLDARIVLTPNFDRIYDGHALSESEGTTLVKKYSDQDIVEYIRRGDRLILKAHGSIDDPHGMIFTRNQYATARTDHSSFYRLLDALVMTSTILMVGVGLDDPDFQLLFEDNRARFEHALPHYMTYGGTPHSDLVETVRETLGTKLLPYSPRTNHAALVTSLRSLVNQVSDKRTILTRTMDW
jgi:hypothetical protein